MKRKTPGAAATAAPHPRSVHGRLAGRCIEAPGRLSISVRRPLAIRHMLTVLNACPNVLFEGDEVKLTLGLSGGGILLLSDGPDGMTCLSPSAMLPQPEPERDGDLVPTGRDWLPVGGPAGNYTLILVCSKQALPRPFVDRRRYRRPAPIGRADLQSLGRWLGDLTEPARIAATPYVVLM